VRENMCHMQRGFVGAMIWERLRMKSICSLFIQGRERFFSVLPFTHTSTLAELMQTTNTIALTKFVACCQYKRNYLSSMICLLSNGLSGPKQT
jgi:hypothetical protein